MLVAHADRAASQSGEAQVRPYVQIQPLPQHHMI